MNEQEQMRQELKQQLEAIQNQILENSIDADKNLDLMKQFTQLTLMVVSFEFTQKVMSDPDFLSQIKTEADKK